MTKNQAFDAVVAMCGRSTYKRDIVNGAARWSGSDLRGKARSYAGKYKAQANALAKTICTKFPDARFEGGNARDGAMILIIPCSDGELRLGAA